MTRSILALFAFGCLLIGIGGAGGCAKSGVGDPCIPEQEYDPTFTGFNDKESSFESKSFQCETRLCLANHFRGRVTCPYGQTEGGNAGKGATEGCTIPGDKNQKVTGRDGNAAVQAQCADRKAADTVYCSCRCANLEGRTDDGANYCECPDDYQCEQLATSIGAGDTGLTGAYCIKKKTKYEDGACLTSCGQDTTDCGRQYQN